MTHDESVNRRRFLKAGGASAAGLLAGCIGGGGGGTPTPRVETRIVREEGGTVVKTVKVTETPTPELDLEARAKQEGDVAVASSTSGLTKFLNTFQDETGINLSYFRNDVEAVATRLIQENQSGNLTFDVWGGGGVQSVVAMVEEGLAPEIPEELYSGSPARLILDGKVAIAYVQQALVLQYNSDIITDPPTTVQEVWDSEHNVVVDVRDSELVLSAQNTYDTEEEVNNWLTTLGENATWVRGHLDASKAVARGEEAMTISYAKFTDYPWGGTLGNAEVEGWPTTAQPLQWGLVDGRPHEDAGAFFLQYHLHNIIPYLKENISESVFVSADQADENGWWYLTAASDVDWEAVDNQWQEQTGFTQRG